MAPLLLAAFFADVLAYSAATKLLDERNFLRALRGYRLFRNWSNRALRPLARIVPLFETAVAVLLLWGGLQRYGALGALALFSSFYVLILKDDRRTFANCGCAGASLVEVPKSAWLTRNLVLVAGSALLAAWSAAPVMAFDSSVSHVLIAAGLMLPVALLVMEIPLVSHIVAVDRANMPAKLAAVRRAQATQGLVKLQTSGG